MKFHGDANGASMTDDAASAVMSAAERKVTFFGQNVWKRAAIVVAGPIAQFHSRNCDLHRNFHRPRPRHSAAGGRKDQSPTAPPRLPVFKPNDIILSIDGNKVDSFEDVQRVVQALKRQGR